MIHSPHRSGMSIPRVYFLAAALVAAAIAQPVAAQQVDVVRGRITSTESLPVEGAQVTVTTVSGAVSRVARTDTVRMLSAWVRTPTSG